MMMCDLPAIAIPIVAATSAISAAAVATPATASAIASAATAARAARATRLINLDLAALEIDVVEFLNGSGRLGRIGHFDESKAARLTGKFIGDYDCAFDLPRLRKQIREFLLSYRIGKIAYVQLRGHQVLLQTLAGKRPNRRP